MLANIFFKHFSQFFKIRVECSFKNKFFLVLLKTVTDLAVLFEPVESRTQGSRPRPRTQKKNPRPSTALLRAVPLEAKDRNARGQGQGHRRKCSPKKKFSKNFFRRSWGNKKMVSQIFREVSGVFQKISTVRKLVLSSSQGQGNFRELEASTSKPRTWPSRPRISKCALEIKDVFEDFTSGSQYHTRLTRTVK